MEEGKKPEDHMTSAAAFVEGGIQDSCDDACSICLEEFSESDPSTVNSLKFYVYCASFHYTSSTQFIIISCDFDL